MKKICILLIFILLVTACDNTPKYFEWKDSIVSFGDGTYQILHQTDNDGEYIKELKNCKHNQCVLTKIDSYFRDNEYVFFCGNYYTKKVFCKLDVNTNMLSYYAEENEEKLIMVYFNEMICDKQIELLSSYDEFSESDKMIFEKIHQQK